MLQISKLLKLRNIEICGRLKVILFNGGIAAEILWRRGKLNTHKMVVDRLPSGNTWKSTGG